MIEIWHPFAGYETHYEVSNLGNVRSIERKAQISERMKNWHKAKKVDSLKQQLGAK